MAMEFVGMSIDLNGSYADIGVDLTKMREFSVLGLDIVKCDNYERGDESIKVTTDKGLYHVFHIKSQHEVSDQDIRENSSVNLGEYTIRLTRVETTHFHWTETSGRWISVE